MSIRLPIGPAAALLWEGAAEFAPAPAGDTVRFADTPVRIVGDENAIRVPASGPGASPRPVPARITYN